MCSPFYFPGYQAKAFQFAQAPSNGHEAFTPLTSQRMIEQVLPSPALLNPQGPVTAYVALKRKGSTAVDGLVITTEAEYVTGERAFFSKAAYAGKSYVQKANALMASTFVAGNGLEVYEQAALETNPGLAMSASDWSMFAADPDLAAMQHRLLTQFLNTMLGAAQNVDDIKVFEGADKPTWFEAMYGVNRMPYVASYLRYIYDARQPTYVSAIEQSYPDYDYSAYVPLSATEGIELAKAAMRFYTWGTEYMLPTKGSSVPVKGPAVYGANTGTIAAWTTSTNGTTSLSNYAPGTTALDLATVPGTTGLPSGWATGLGLDSPYASGSAGSPLPYVRGGIDSPRTFAMAMQGVYGSARKPGYALPPSVAGVDGMGLVTGALAMTSYAGSIEALQKNIPAVTLDGYFKSGTKPTGVARLTRSDLEKCSILVPNLSDLQVGDLVLHYGEGEGKYGDALKVGVIVYAPVTGRPVPGQDPSAYLKTVVVVGAQEGDRQVSLSTWLSNGQTTGFADASMNFHVRRLVRVPATIGQAEGKAMMARAIMTSPARGALKAMWTKESTGPAYAVTAGLSDRDIGWNQWKPAKRGDQLAQNVAYSSATIPGGDAALGRLHSLVNSKINDLVFTYDSSYDSSSNPGVAGSRQRWIPNTGQFLVLDKLRLKAKNADKAAIDLYREWALNGGFQLEIGVNDRGFDPAKDPTTYGNIYCNQGDGFEFVGMPDGGSFDKDAAVKICELDRNDGQAVYTTSYTNSDVFDKDGKPKASGTKFTIMWDELELLYNGKQITRFAIRPKSTNIHPGDDILPIVQVEEKSSLDGRTTFFIEKSMDDTDYLAIYDKKMLWRANLYLNQPEDALGGMDWNSAYPWNAPPAEGRPPVGGIPAWWSVGWGYNEWNRKWDGTGDYKAGFTGLSQLPVGDGKQVISFLPFTPIRTLGGSISEPRNENKLGAAVAYSFPYHRYEPFTGDSGSQDSPFDYMKKMLIQSAQLKETYNSIGTRFVKAKSTWPKPNAVSASDFASMEVYASNVQVIDFVAVNVWASANKKQWYDYPAIKNFSLLSWTKGTLAPSDMWWRYDVSMPNNWSEASHSPATKAFVPSLGLKIGSKYGILKTDEYDENFHPDNDTITRDSFADRSYVIESGTDCVGFAQRSSSYSGRNYRWRALPNGWTETGSTRSGTDDIWVALGEYNGDSNGRLFVRSGSNAADILAKNIADDSNSDDLAALRKVVPGDIWIKYSSVSVSQQSATTPSHIAIVAYVPTDTSINDPLLFMNQIILIEGEYTNKIQSVIKKLSVGMYNDSLVPQGTGIYPNFEAPVVGAAQGIPLNCQSWAIRRLK